MAAIGTKMRCSGARRATRWPSRSNTSVACGGRDVSSVETDGQARPAHREDDDFLSDGPLLEARIRAWAIPSALLFAFLLVSTGPGRAVVRIFFSMWVHELGHAVAAWLCGVLAVPGPWRTLTGSG